MRQRIPVEFREESPVTWNRLEFFLTGFNKARSQLKKADVSRLTAATFQNDFALNSVTWGHKQKVTLPKIIIRKNVEARKQLPVNN